MATLYLDNPALELRTDGRALALYRDGARERTLPLQFLDRVVIQGDVRLSAGAVGRLAEAGAAILFLSKRNSRRLASVVGPPHADARIRIAHYAACADAAFRAKVAAALVCMKLRGQQRFLSICLAQRPDVRKPLTDGKKRIERCLDRLREETEPTVERAMGLEGAAAAAYFAALPAMFPPALGFAGRNRRPPRDPVNAALSLAYTLLHHEAIAAAHAAGLDPWLGFLHTPAYARESLACDLVEPLRPHADAWVLALFRQRELRREDFRMDKGACLLGKAGRRRFHAEYERFAVDQRRRLRRLCRLVIRAVRERGEELFDADCTEAAVS